MYFCIFSFFDESIFLDNLVKRYYNSYCNKFYERKFKMKISKKLLAIILSISVAASLCACKNDTAKKESKETPTNSVSTENNPQQNENSDVNAVEEESKVIENTQITEKEFNALVDQANSDDEQVKKEALEKLQVILDEVEKNSQR